MLFIFCMKLELDPQYYLGIDMHDKNNNCLCLVKKQNGITEFILADKHTDENAFKKEADRIAKFYDAAIIADKDSISKLKKQLE